MAGGFTPANSSLTKSGFLARASLTLQRNGMILKAGLDYTLTGSTISFIPAATPQSGDVLQAFYRH